MILHQHAIEEDCDVCWRFQRALGVEDRSRPHHVIHLPLSGLAVWVDQWNPLLVDAAGLAVDVGPVVIRIEDLQLISGVARTGGSQKHATVTSRLTSAIDVFRDSPLNVKLVVPKGPFGFNIANNLIHSEYSAGNNPLS